MGKRRTGDFGPYEPAHGRDVAARWLTALGLSAVPRWHIEVGLEAGHGTRFNLNVYAEEWGFAFHHARRSSWIRVTDIPFVHGRDDFGLLATVPELPALNTFVCQLEAQHGIELLHLQATVRTNISNAAPIVRRWLAQPSIADSDQHMCGDEMHGGIRCTLARGHAGHHAFKSGDGALRWKQSH